MIIKRPITGRVLLLFKCFIKSKVCSYYCLLCVFTSTLFTASILHASTQSLPWQQRTIQTLISNGNNLLGAAAAILFQRNAPDFFSIKPSTPAYEDLPLNKGGALVYSDLLRKAPLNRVLITFNAIEMRIYSDQAHFEFPEEACRLNKRSSRLVTCINFNVSTQINGKTVEK